MYRRHARLSWRAIGEQTVIVDAKGQRLFGLNSAGGRVWHALDGEAGAAELAARQGVPAEDVARFLGELIASGLVESDEDEPPGIGEPGVGTESPRVLWQEEIQTFARACAFFPGMNTLCNINPRS